MFYFMLFGMVLFCAAPSVFSPRHVLVNGREVTRPKLPLVIFAFLPIIIFIGFRSYFADTTTYVNIYISAERTFANSIGNGYDFYVFIMKSLNVDVYYALFGFCLLSCILLIRGIYKNSDSLIISMYYLMGSAAFYWLANGIRQFMAVCIIFNLLPLIAQRKALPYTLGVLVAIWFHKSAIIMLPVFFLVNNKPFSVEMIVKVMGFILALFVIFILPPLRDLFLDIISFNEYSAGIDSTVGGSIFRVLIALIPTFMAGFFRDELNRENNKLISVCINLSFMSAGLYLIAVFTSGVYLGRVPIYMSIGELILFPYLFKLNTNKDWKYVLSIVFLVFYGAFFIYTFIHMNYASYVLGIKGGTFYW